MGRSDNLLLDKVTKDLGVLSIDTSVEVDVAKLVDSQACKVDDVQASSLHDPLSNTPITLLLDS